MKQLVTLLFLFISILGFGQGIKQKTIRFESNSYELSSTQENDLREWIQDLIIIQVELTGHTDNIGNDKDNELLSKNRTESIASFLLSIGVKEEWIQKQYQGESNPIASNENATGKAENRRVEILIRYEIVEPIIEDPPVEISKEVKEEPLRVIQRDNRALYAKLRNQIPEQRFTIHPQRDTAVKTIDGLIFYFKKGTFETSCKEEIDIVVKEYNNKSLIVQNNLQTVSDGKRLYSVGMYDLRAYCDDQEIQLKNGENYLSLLPALNEGEKEDVEFFYGIRDKITDEVNWVPDTNRSVRQIGGGLLCGNNLDREKICFLKRLFRPNGNRISRKELKEQQEIREKIQAKYKNVDFNKMGELPDEEISYFVFQPNRAGLVNYDVFTKSNKPLLVQKIEIDKEISKDTDVKLVFLNQKSVISADKVTNKYFEFSNVPKNSNAYLVALKLEEDQTISLGIKKIKISGETEEIELSSVKSFEELEERLSKIN